MVSLSFSVSVCLSLSPALGQSGGETFRWYRDDRSSWRSQRYAESVGTHVKAAENRSGGSPFVCVYMSASVSVRSCMHVRVGKGRL